MPKLKNVTDSDLKAAEEQAFDISQVASDLHQRATQGYADTIPEPMRLASSFLSASRTMADLAAWLLMKAALQEQERTIETQLRKRAAEK